MAEAIMQQFVNRAVAMGPVVLMQGMHLERPTDVVETSALSVNEKRTILAAWASDLYALYPRPARRQLPGTPEAVSIDDVREAPIAKSR